MGEYHAFGAPGNNASDIPGVNHSDELYYQWNPLDLNPHPLNEDDSSVSRRITTMWSNFIKFGDPTVPGMEVTWSPQTTEDRRYLVIDSDLRMDLSEDYQDRMSFWKTLDL